jgi:predicted DNA binding CopG/RHH family protein
MINFWAREAFTIMALRKEEFHHEDKQQEANTMKRSRITIDISPELRRRIKVAASQRDLSISEYLGQILEENVPEEMNLVEQDVHPVPSDILEEVDRIRERVIRESKGHIFEDSAEVLRQQREERTQYLEELREQP